MHLDAAARVLAAGRPGVRALDRRFLQGAKGADKALLPLRCRARCARFAQQIKWQHVRYGPIDLDVWGVLNRIYAFAELRGVAEARVNLYAGGVESTPRQEFLKAAMFSACSPDSLLPLEIELAERLIDELAPSFAHRQRSRTRELLYWTDLAQPTAPLRSLRAPKPAPSAALLRAGQRASAALQALIAQDRDRRAQVPAELNLGANYDAEAVLERDAPPRAVLGAASRPSAGTRATACKSRLTVAHGFDGVIEALGGGGDSLDFDPRPRGESWIVENVSAGGFGAVVPQAKSDWLQGRRAARDAARRRHQLGGRHGAAREHASPTGRARVGIETLSRAPALSRFALRGAERARACCCRRRCRRRRGLDRAARRASTPAARTSRRAVGGKQHVYMPQAVAERGDDYEIVQLPGDGQRSPRAGTPEMSAISSGQTECGIG